MKNNIQATLSYLLISFLLCSTAAISPLTRRAIIDIGSLGTKIEVADIDTNTNRVMQTIYKDSTVVPYKDDLAHHVNPQCFSEPVIQKGLDVIKQFVQHAQGLNPQPTHYHIIATEGFRSVPCSTTLAQRFEKETGIPVTIISQNEEARLAFNGIVAKSNMNPANIVSWEIGGGSTQIAMKNGTGDLVIFGAPIGGVTFKNLVIASVHHKQLTETSTPNPLGYDGAEKAIKLGEILAHRVPTLMKEKIQQSSVKILATGATNNWLEALGSFTEGTTVKRETIEQAFFKLVDAPDEKLFVGKTKLDTTVAIPGIALMIGFMKHLGIEEITLIKCAMRAGALIDPRYFENT